MKEIKLKENTVVHCETKKLAQLVHGIAEKHGYRKTLSSMSNNGYNWNIYRDKTCYNLVKGTRSSLAYYQKVGFNIISAEEFINLHKQ